MKRKKVKQKIDRKNHTARDCAVEKSDTRERRMCDTCVMRDSSTRVRCDAGGLATSLAPAPLVPSAVGAGGLAPLAPAPLSRQQRLTALLQFKVELEHVIGDVFLLKKEKLTRCHS